MRKSVPGGRNTVRSHLCDIQKRQNYSDTEQISVARSQGWDVRARGSFWTDGSGLYPHFSGGHKNLCSINNQKTAHQKSPFYCMLRDKIFYKINLIMSVIPSFHNLEI